MRFGSLFSGIGGFDLGLEHAGHECAFQVERDPFCLRVLAERWPNVRRWTDVRRVGAGMVDGASANDSGSDSEPQGLAECGHLDLLVAGWPCQDLSVAGKRAGLGGARSGLFFEILRIAQALKPTWFLGENVPGLFSSHGGRDMATVLEGLRQCWPVVGYRVLDSQHFGVAQRRRRVFFVGGPTEAGVAEVLALTEGGGGHLAAGGEAGERATGPPGDGAYGTGRRDEDDPNLVLADGDTETFVMGVSENQRAELRLTEISRQITSGGGKPGQGYPAVLVSGLLAKTNGGWRMGADEAAGGMLTVAHALSAEGHDASEDGTGRGTPLVSFRHNASSSEHGVDINGTLNAENQHAIAGGSLVRRLTPVECERLQGFQDGWTCLCQPLAAYAADPDGAALACTCPDSPRYRALGNAVTVNVISWLSERLAPMSPPAARVGRS